MPHALRPLPALSRSASVRSLSAVLAVPVRSLSSARAASVCLCPLPSSARSVPVRSLSAVLVVPLCPGLPPSASAGCPRGPCLPPSSASVLCLRPLPLSASVRLCPLSARCTLCPGLPLFALCLLSSRSLSASVRSARCPLGLGLPSSASVLLRPPPSSSVCLRLPPSAARLVPVCLRPPLSSLRPLPAGCRGGLLRGAGCASNFRFSSQISDSYVAVWKIFRTFAHPQSAGYGLQTS